MRINAKDPSLISFIGDFLKVYLPSIRNRDQDTIDSYKSTINLYLLYLQTAFDITLMTVQSGDFNQKNIVSFMSWLKNERGNVAPTINHRLSDIRGFCKYLAKKKAITSLGYEEIREIEDAIDERVTEFTWLSIDDIKSILEQISTSRDAIRDRFLFSLLYESGARIDEVLSLTLKDIKPAAGGEADVHFFGKGRKHRITPLSNEIWNQFQNYCKKYHPEKECDALLFYTFRSKRRNKMSRDNIARILNTCEENLREQKPELLHLHAHLFRRSRAMHLYEAGVPLPTISEWLGHSNIETTRFYTQITTQMKRDALHKLSESDKSVFKDDVAFKYAGNEEMLQRLCGLK